MFAFTLNVVCLAISFAFPVITTYKALKSNNTQLLKPWVIYWLVYAGLSGFENSFYYLLSFIPFYPFLKLYVCLWLILPQSKGAEFIYFKHVEPFLAKHEAGFENWLENFNVWDYVYYLKDYFIPNGPSTRRVGKEPDSPGQTGSFFDVLIEKFYKEEPLNPGTKELTLLDSLGGVLNALPFSLYSSKTGLQEKNLQAEGVAQEAKEIVDGALNLRGSRSFETVTSAINDYDFVGKEEYENFGKDLKTSDTSGIDSKPAKPAANNGWFSGWWSSTEKVKGN